MGKRKVPDLYRAPFPLYTVKVDPKTGLIITAGGGGASKTGIKNAVVSVSTNPFALTQTSYLFRLLRIIVLTSKNCHFVSLSSPLALSIFHNAVVIEINKMHRVWHNLADCTAKAQVSM